MAVLPTVTALMLQHCTMDTWTDVSVVITW